MTVTACSYSDVIILTVVMMIMAITLKKNTEMMNKDIIILIITTITTIIIITLKQTQRLKGRVKMTMTQEMAVKSQPQRPMPVSTSSPDIDNRHMYR